MPTPFYHLNVAEIIIEHSGLLSGISDLINRYQSAFLFGNVSPDVQVVSGQTRESTHFYSLPTQSGDNPPWKQMLNSYSTLSNVENCDPEQAVFVAGYLCHLQADWYWVRQIFEPFFGPNSNWKSFRERLYLHNVLRSYLDFLVLDSLKIETCTGLSLVRPDEWLPFVEIDHLIAWRDMLADQLEPGAPVHTVEVFASRQGISAENYYKLLKAEDEMQYQVFDYLPRKNLDVYRFGLLSENISLVNEYLAKVGGNSNANSEFF